MSEPAVTVLLCVLDGERFIRDAIDSILAQSYGNLELLVVDDASNDGTHDILRSYHDRRLRILRNATNIGLTRSLNAGLCAARGLLIARHDADDISLPERLARQVTFLDANPEVVALGTQSTIMDFQGRRRPFDLAMKCETPLGIRWQLMFENPFVHSSVMLRREVIVHRFGGYNENFLRNQDFELWSRLSRQYPLRNLPEPLVAVRARPGSVSGGYSAESIKLVRDVYLANALFTIAADPVAQAGIEVLVQAMCPRLYAPVRDLRPLIAWIDHAYERFVDRWPEARRLREIRVQSASFIARTTTACAAASPAIMSRWYMESARYHFPTFVRGGARFAAAGMRALWHPIFGR